MSKNICLKTTKNITKEKIIYKNLSKYNKTVEKIFQNKIKNLMFHKKSHFTAIFTEYLIWDDNQEFLFDIYPKRFSLPNLSSYIKIQCNKFFIPIIINNWGRKLLKLNVKMKKLLISQMTDKSKQLDPSKYILKKYSKILPSDLSENISDTIEFREDYAEGSFKTFKNCCLKRNNEQNLNNNNQNILTNNFPLKGKEISESESTIDNVNANNDISISLDLKMNKKYDDKILDQNVGFVIGQNGKNDEDLLKMMKYLKPINTNHIYQNNKNKLTTNYIYLNYVNNKIYRLTENTNKSSKNKSNNKKKNINNNNNVYNNENLKNFSKNINNSNNNTVSKIITSKNTSLNKNKKNNEQKNSISKNINNKLYSKSNNKVNSSKNTNNLNNNINNNNITNVYNDQNNKTTSTKTNSYNISYKNKSENQKQVIANNRNKKNNNYISQHNSDIKIITPFSNESKISQENLDNKDITTIRNGSSKLWKKNAKLNSEENSKVQTIIFPKKKIFNLKEKNCNNLKTTNNINNVNNINIYSGEIKNIKRNQNKILDISSDVKKMKFLISSKDENSYINKLSGIKIIKKEKSLDNKPLNNGIYKKGNSQISNKKNIIIVKRKISDGINTFHKI